jgi:putative ABC transport system permease protein
MQGLLKDLRYGLRTLLKEPTFALIAVVTLALGIGANTAIFSVIDAVLLRPLPYAESDRLVLVNERSPQMDGMSISWPNYVDWRAQNQVFEKIAVFNRGNYNLTGNGEPERILTAQTTADLFATLRVNAALGRVYTEEEDKPGATPVVVLSHGLWQRRFGGDPSVVNRTIQLNDRAYTVIGVMPQGFQFPSRVEMWTPAGPLSAQPNWQQRGNHPGLYGVARLKPGVTIEQARADMDNIAAGLEKLYPNSNQGNRVRMMPLLENYVRDVRRALWFMFGAVGMVLLIACANVANLLLARAATRQKEMAVRTALGAGRWRIARQLLTESVLLALIGGGVGLSLAPWGVKLILYISPDAIPRAQEIGVDVRVLAFTIAVSVLTGVIFGLVPAWQSGKVDVHETLKEAGRGNTGSRQWLRGGLVVTEIASALFLLVCAGLLIRSFYRLQQVNPGFSYDRLLSFTITLPQRKYNTQQQSDFYQQLIEKTRALPGVESVAVASGLPLGNNGWQTSFTVEGQPAPPPGQTPLMEACVVSSDYFKAMGIPLKAGRYFTDQDNRQHLASRDLSGLSEEERQIAGLNSIVIDEEFARRHWPNEDAVGKRLRLGTDPKMPTLTVVGVVGRVKIEDSLRSESRYVQGYFPFLQLPFGGMTVVVKHRLEPEQMTAAVRQQVLSLDPNQPVYNIRTMDQIHDESVASEKLNLTLLGLFASVALALAMVGIYGVISYSVTQRTHEIGIRVALGARGRDVLGLVIGQGMKLALVGVAGGVLISLALTRLMETLLFNVKATDPLTFAAIALLLTLVALLACYLPARRAAKVDPMIALRHE